MICYRSAAHMSLVLSFLLNPRAMAVDFEQIIVPVLLYLALFVNQTLICSMSAALVHWGYLAVQFWFNGCCCFEQVTVSIRLFFTWVLCIYVILDKGCHILYVFGLNSTVCSHIVGMHLSSDQVTYGFMMDADLYNSFLLCLRIKSFQKPSVCISL